MRILRPWLCMLSVVAVSFSARADEEAPPAPSRWSVLGPLTVGAQRNLLEGSLGYPGAAVTYRRGVAPVLDLGVRASFTSSLEGLARVVMPGLKLQALLRVKLFDSQKVSFGLVFEPGPWVVFDRAGYGTVGFSIPVGARLGIAVANKVGLTLAADVPVWLQFGTGASINVPVLLGAGVEFFVLPSLALFVRVQTGPTFRPFGLVEITFDGALGVGWRL